MVAGALGRAGADIQAIDVVEAGDGRALDDLTVVVERGRVADVVDALNALDGVEVVYAGPSRGLPGDAVARLALGLESLLNGAMALDHAVATLVGGLVGASRAELVAPGNDPPPSDTVLVLDFHGEHLVVERDYRFTDAERERVAAILRSCVEAARARSAPDR